MALRECVASLLNSTCGRLGGRFRGRRLHRLIIQPVHEWLQDRSFGIETRLVADVTDVDRAQCPDAKDSVPTVYSVLGHVLRSIRPDDVFVDLGCGSGRVVCYVAGKMRLKKVIGVELMPKMVECAKQNVANAKLLTPVDIVQGNAANANLGEGTAYYLYNPFGEETLRQVLANIHRSLAASPRTVRVLYYNPIFEEVLDACDWLTAEQTIKPRFSRSIKPFLRIWRSTV